MTATRKDSIFTAIAHRWKAQCGNPQSHTGEVTHEERQKTFEKPAKAAAKCTSMPKTRVLRVRLVKGLRVSMWVWLALLVIRHFCPEVQEQIPAVYQFMDNVALPILDWLYAIVMKGVQWFTSLPGVRSVLEALKNLAM